jgi:hypothetical protein
MRNVAGCVMFKQNMLNVPRFASANCWVDAFGLRSYRQLTGGPSEIGVPVSSELVTQTGPEQLQHGRHIIGRAQRFRT